ncbi:MAG: hypothetical protein UY49_C0014G0001, partial [Microgenomates group bacterium GW2011_GWC1_49_7]
MLYLQSRYFSGDFVLWHAEGGEQALDDGDCRLKLRLDDGVHA